MKLVLEGPPTDPDMRLQITSMDDPRGREAGSRPRLLGRLSADALMNSLDVEPASVSLQMLLERGDGLPAARLRAIMWAFMRTVTMESSASRSGRGLFPGRPASGRS
jgi:hypothetical protein